MRACGACAVVGLRAVCKLFGMRPADGAKFVVHAVTAPELQGRGYLFLRKGVVDPPKNKLVQDTRAQEELWRVSEDLLNHDYTL